MPIPVAETTTLYTTYMYYPFLPSASMSHSLCHSAAITHMHNSIHNKTKNCITDTPFSVSRCWQNATQLLPTYGNLKNTHDVVLTSYLCRRRSTVNRAARTTCKWNVHVFGNATTLYGTPCRCSHLKLISHCLYYTWKLRLHRVAYSCHKQHFAGNITYQS